MKKMLVLLAVAALVAGSALVAVADDNGPAKITLSAKMGDITFPHDAHQKIAGDCVKCHHKGLEQPNCHSCHGEGDAPKAKDVFHKLCKDCHKKMNGPTKCKGCHVK